VRALVKMAPDSESRVPLAARILANVESVTQIGGWKLTEEKGRAELQLILDQNSDSSNDPPTWKMKGGRPSPADTASEVLSTPAQSVSEPFPIFPESWNDSPGLEPADRWAADSFCRNGDSIFRPLCARLELLFDQRPLMHLFGWYLAAAYPVDFLETCKSHRLCSWKIDQKSPHIDYVVKNGDEPTTYRFTIDTDEKTIVGGTERSRALLLVMGYPDGVLKL